MSSIRLAFSITLLSFSACVFDLPQITTSTPDVFVEPEPVCGNGILEEGENCDLGADNGTGICPADCIISDEDTICGDGFISGDETCDDEINDGSYNSCTEDCQLTLRCGDGIVQEEFGESCDDEVNDGSYNSCANDCSERAPFCGDGEITDGELCDDESPGEYNGCGADCFTLGPRCGDGIVQSEHEFCDDAINDGSYGGCSSDCSTAPGAVLFSEIMYNPIGRDDYEERHEFIELHNPNPGGENLNGWRLEGGVEFTFPGGTNLSGNGHLVIAKDRDALLALYDELNPNIVVGNFDGTLKNGGEEIRLVRADGSLAESVEYNDDLPWPRGADGLGADERWLSGVDDLTPYRFKGRSLERVSMALGAQLPQNWVASSLEEGPSPGVLNPARRETPLAQALDVSVRDSLGDRVINADEAARLSLTISPEGRLESLAIEYFVDELDAENENVQRVSLEPSRRQEQFDFPLFAERTLVRYRIVGDRGEGEEVIAPRQSDPQEWFAFYITPAQSFATTTYDLLIAPSAWQQAWNNLDAGGNGRVNGCDLNPNWQSTVPATFVHDGHVYDVEVRFQGSRYQRFNGNDLPNFAGIGPNGGAPIRTLSWRVQFPDYDRFNKKEIILLNKLVQSCNGVPQGVGFGLFADVGIPAPEINYARLVINGGYYNYVLQLDHMNERTIEKFFKDYAERTGSEAQEVGHLFKAKGIHSEEGPFESGDGGLIPAGCNYSAQQRYEATFDRKTHSWLDNSELIALIEGLDAARTQGGANFRNFVEANFDIDTMLNHLAIMNWLAPWDDVFHNYYVYQRRDNQKWSLIPWDLDLTFGLFYGGRTDTSLFIGQEANPDNRGGRTQFFKDAVLQTHRDEYLARVAELNQTLFEPSAMQSRIDAFYESVSVAEAAAAPAGAACNFDERTNAIRNWVQARHTFVQSQMP